MYMMYVFSRAATTQKPNNVLPARETPGRARGSGGGCRVVEARRVYILEMIPSAHGGAWRLVHGGGAPTAVERAAPRRVGPWRAPPPVPVPQSCNRLLPHVC